MLYMKVQTMLRIILILGLVHHAFSACENVKLVCRAGKYGHEISWSILDQKNREIKKQIGTRDTSDTSNKGCSGGTTTNMCLEQGQTYTIRGKDEWGDGWNGGSISIVGIKSSETYLSDWTGPSGSKGTSWAAQSFDIPPPPSSSCVNVDIECIPGKYAWEVAWRIEQGGKAVVKGPRATNEQPSASGKYGCIRGDRKRACLEPGLSVAMIGSCAYGDGWDGATLKVVDVKTKNVYKEWSGPPASFKRNQEAKIYFTIPAGTKSSTSAVKYTIPSSPSKSMKLKWNPTGRSYPLHFLWYGTYYSCNDYYLYCYFKIENGQPTFIYKKNKKSGIGVQYEGQTISLASFLFEMSKPKQLNAKDVNTGRAVNSHGQSFGNCFGNPQADWHKGACIDPRYDYCKGSGLGSGCADNAKCCKKGCFASCDANDLGCGNRKSYYRSDCVEKIPPNTILAYNALLQKGESSLRSSSTNNKCNNPKDAPRILSKTKYVREFLWNTVEVYGLSGDPNSLLKNAKHQVSGKSLHDLGVLVDGNGFIFNCCSKSNICSVVNDASKGTDQIFQVGATSQLRIQKVGSDVKWEVLQAKGNRRRLLSLMEGKRGRSC